MKASTLYTAIVTGVVLGGSVALANEFTKSSTEMSGDYIEYQIKAYHPLKVFEWQDSRGRHCIYVRDTITNRSGGLHCDYGKEKENKR